MNLTRKIIEKHLVSGRMTAGEEIAIRIDQTLTQDSTGTMAYLQLEALGIDKVKTLRSVAYIDHNTIQSGFENADDHAYIRSVALKHGIYVSKPGNGICHQVNVERFGVPGQTLVGSDSHTPTGGGIGMLAIGAGGLDVAVAMGGGALYLSMPKVVNVELSGTLNRGVSAKDVILEVLRVLTVKGGVGKVMEYTGEGVKTLTVPERATIANMGAELGATTSIFPSDEQTRAFLAAQGREKDFTPARGGPRFRVRRAGKNRLVKARAACRLSALARQREKSERTQLRQGRPGVHRQLHEFVLPRHDARCRDTERQARPPRRQPYDKPGLAAGFRDACRQRRARGHDKRRRESARMRLRTVHRHGAVAQKQRRFRAYFQPQLLCSQRNENRFGVPRFARNRGLYRA